MHFLCARLCPLWSVARLSPFDLWCHVHSLCMSHGTLCVPGENRSTLLITRGDNIEESLGGILTMQYYHDILPKAVILWLSNCKARNPFLSVCLLVICVIWRTINPKYFTLGRFVTEDSGMCSFEFGTIWTCKTFNISKVWINNRLNTHYLMGRLM